MHAVKLNNGTQIPSVGFGTFLLSPGRQTYQAVQRALKLGYRHIDTAQLYGNEPDIARAIAASGVKRQEVYLTTKLWESEWGYRKASGAIQDRLAALDITYIDLLLLHTPGNPSLRAETWKALEDAHEQGHLKSIGVSNFGVGHLEKLLQTAHVVPAVNQIELTPFLQRKKLVDYCQSKHIVLEAYSPLCKGSGSKLNDSTVREVADELGVTPAQILIRWSVQQGFVPLPKAVSEEHQATNFDVFGFSLGESQMQRLNALDVNYVTAWDPTETDPV